MSKFYSSYRELREQLLSKAVTCESVVKQYLNQIAQTKHLNIFITVFEDSALARAKALDQKLSLGVPPGKTFLVCRLL